MVSPRQEYWKGLPFPSSGDLFNPWIEPTSSVFTSLAGEFFTTEPPGKQDAVSGYELVNLIPLLDKLDAFFT